MSVINNLLKIKIYREEKAELALLKAKQDLRLKEKKFLEAKEKLSAFTKECNERERELYADLCSRLVVQKDLDDVAYAIQLMKDQTETFEQQVESARIKKDEAKEHLESAKMIHREAVRMREKFMEIRKIEEEEKEAEALRIEDIEMEEVAGSRFSKCI